MFAVGCLVGAVVTFVVMVVYALACQSEDR